ncbi:hypothetical protein EYZ11_008012 [Aspergillus tanneri]|nr:hypothetical protein EYZ11_008012 [Aspergillus tanneri]
MAYSTVVQVIIYNAGQCYKRPLECAEADGHTPDRIHVLIQLPRFMVVALAEVYCWSTGLEYSYNHSPKSMKLVLQAVYIGPLELGYALGMASPLAMEVVLWEWWLKCCS